MLLGRAGGIKLSNRVVSLYELTQLALVDLDSASDMIFLAADYTSDLEEYEQLFKEALTKAIS